MFYIRRLFDEVVPANRDALNQVRQILRRQLPDVREHEVTGLGERLVNPFLQRFRSIILVAENSRHRVLGFAVILHEPQIAFCYLDFIATARAEASQGIGGALYERVRDEARALTAKGLFFECLPDDRERCPDDRRLRSNQARLRFYERYGARPLVGNDYHRPLENGGSYGPYLVYDGLGNTGAPRRSWTRQVVRAILERKYAFLCPTDYVQAVVDSFREDPVALRPPRYQREEIVRSPAPLDHRVCLVASRQHEFQQVHDRGMVEAPVRIDRILQELQRAELCRQVAPKEHPAKVLHSVHDAELVRYLRRVCRGVPPARSIYPNVFPLRNQARPPRILADRAGYYCIDTFTPLNENALRAARMAADCALTAAELILAGERLAYALVQPPGHHAGRRYFGGTCYFNNAALCAQLLSQVGQVAILDIDYHHGSGQQDIFYRRSDVLTVSIHGHPHIAYPHFTGFEDEIGEDQGLGFNLNIPLAKRVDGHRYLQALKRALAAIRQFDPRFLVLAFGLDTAKADPTGSWFLTSPDFHRCGHHIGGLNLPTVIVQESGYRTRAIGTHVRTFLEGVLEGMSLRDRAPVGKEIRPT
ncbi:MAG: histone deacetylase family protein [Bradymonadales bacterium]|nr:histone deacetylase family protein [Bradymonadales bacterium]